MRPTCAFAAQIGWKSPCLWKLAHFRDLVDAATDVVGSVGDMRTDPAPAMAVVCKDGRAVADDFARKALTAEEEG
jgi:hypothetical protein